MNKIIQFLYLETTLNFKLITASALAFGSVVVAHAQTVDQEDLLNNTIMAGFGQTDLAQSFQQASSDIDGAGFYIFSGYGDGAASTVTVSLYTALPNAGGNLLTSGSVNLTGYGQWADVYWNDISITANKTYYLVITSTDQSEGIAGDTTDQYTRGEVFANSGYDAYPNYDYTFETFKAQAVPEPISMTLLGAGALGLITRRLKKS